MIVAVGSFLAGSLDSGSLVNFAFVDVLIVVPFVPFLAAFVVLGTGVVVCAAVVVSTDDQDQPFGDHSLWIDRSLWIGIVASSTLGTKQLRQSSEDYLVLVELDLGIVRQDRRFQPQEVIPNEETHDTIHP